MDKGSGTDIFPDPDPGELKRTDPKLFTFEWKTSYPFKFPRIHFKGQP